jgi:hypothetical protein
MAGQHLHRQRRRPTAGGLLFATLTLGAVVLGGCGGGYSGDEGEMAGPAVFADVRVAPATVVAGDATTIRVVLHNRGEGDLILDLKGEHVFGYRVRSAEDDRVVAWFPWQNKVEAQQVVVAKRDSLVQEFRFSTRRRAEGWNPTDPVLSAGAYRVQAGLAEHADTYPWAETMLQVTRSPL